MHRVTAFDTADNRHTISYLLLLFGLLLMQTYLHLIVLLTPKSQYPAILAAAHGSPIVTRCSFH